MIYNISIHKLKINLKNRYNILINNINKYEWIIENTSINNLEFNITFDLIKKYSYKWNYNNLSKNPNLTEEFILKYPYQNWDIEYLIENNKITDFKALSKFKYINSIIIKKYLHKQWDWNWIIENFNVKVIYLMINYIPIDIIINYRYYIWNYFILSKHPYLTQNIILNNIYQKWDIEYLINNNIIKNKNKFRYYNYIFTQNDYINNNPHIYRINKISYNKNINEKFILQYPNKQWDIEYLIENNKITNFKALSKFKYINSTIINIYPDKPWDWVWIIENTSINIEKHIPINLIKKYLYRWDYLYLSKNPNLTEEFILNHPYKNWDIIHLIDNNKITNFKLLSKFKNINQYIINNYKNKPWDWEWLIENTIIEIDYLHAPLYLIEKFKNKLNYQKLSKNINITEEFILKYPYKNWTISYLIQNNKITNYKKLSIFMNINKSILNKYKNKPWDWEWIINNRNIEIIPLDIKKYYYNKLKNYYL